MHLENSNPSNYLRKHGVKIWAAKQGIGTPCFIIICFKHSHRLKRWDHNKCLHLLSTDNSNRQSQNRWSKWILLLKHLFREHREFVFLPASFQTVSSEIGSIYLIKIKSAFALQNHIKLTVLLVNAVIIIKLIILE